MGMEPKNKMPWWMKRPFANWDRFGIRHMILWTGAVALAIGLVKFYVHFELSIKGGSGLWEAALSGIRYQTPLRGPDILFAIGLGTLFGIGLPAAMARSSSVPFWKHPGRVLFALFAGTATVSLGASLSGFILFRGFYEHSQMLMQLGAASTYLVFALYALFRSRVGLLWRFSLLVWVLVVVLEICLYTTELAVPMASMSVVKTLILVLLATQFLFLVLLLISGVMDVALRRAVDWRVFSASLLLPLYVLAIQFPLLEVIYQAYRLDNL